MNILQKVAKVLLHNSLHCLITYPRAKWSEQGWEFKKEIKKVRNKERHILNQETDRFHFFFFLGRFLGRERAFFLFFLVAFLGESVISCLHTFLFSTS